MKNEKRSYTLPLVQASACTSFLEASASKLEADASRWLPQADACGSSSAL